MANLAVYMNGYRVGTFTKTTSGTHQFQYHESWLAQPGSRPISLSMPLRHQPYRSDEAYNFCDNLLPDNTEVRNRVVARYQAASTQPFDLLSCIGQDSVGALQLVTEGHPAIASRLPRCHQQHHSRGPKSPLSQAAKGPGQSGLSIATGQLISPQEKIQNVAITTLLLLI
ncbi:MAG: HipA N-terminal domain-containing protein [Aeromonas sp.]|uniref:HipA N-terminal domain-containing protein n=1 Tax=Aeromonas sp. TaxID=647 RepID=UPI003D6BBEAE